MVAAGSVGSPVALTPYRTAESARYNPQLGWYTVAVADLIAEADDVAPVIRAS
jgi:hypothetical protein